MHVVMPRRTPTRGKFLEVTLLVDPEESNPAPPTFGHGDWDPVGSLDPGKRCQSSPVDGRDVGQL